MNASDSNPEAQIVTVTPVVLSEGQRSLAAIVFTDAANFSALMSRDELLARRLIGRDLAGMRAICEENGGSVLKSTGDGLLMIFGSAVRAVSCALDIQSRLREQNRERPFSERLAHRIGIHLGDVFRQEGDVIGDGVNIAARLEAIGWRGCVCVSGTVYEVVQNRLSFYVLKRKLQKLKNVGRLVVYQLAPIGGPFRYFFQAWTFLRLSDTRVLKIVIILSAFLILCLLPGKIRILSDDFGSFEDPLHKYAVQLGQFGNAEDADWNDDSSPEPSGVYPAPGKSAVSEDEFAVARFNDVKKYDFAAMSDWLGRYDDRDRDGDKLRIVSTSIQRLFDWARAHLQSYSEGNPLIVRDNEGRAAYEFWPAPNGAIACKLSSTEISPVDDQIPPAIMGQMLARLLEQGASTEDQASEDLWRGLKFFTSVYQVELPSAIRKEMNRYAQESIRHAGRS